MKTFIVLIAATLCGLAGCADQSKVVPVNPDVPYSNPRGPGMIGSPPLQQGSVPTR